MNITHLRYAAEVGRTGSISQAAENLGVGQPNLSKALKELEAKLGVALFTRTSRGAVPTPQGQALLQQANALLSQLDELESLFASPQEHPTLTVAATPSPLLAPALAETAVRLGIEAGIAMTAADKDEVLRAVAEGADGGLVRCTVQEAAAITARAQGLGLTVQIWRQAAPVVIFSRSHPLAQSHPLVYPELTVYPRLSDGDRLPTLPDGKLKHASAAPDRLPVCRIDDAAVRLMMLGRRTQTYCFDEPLPPLLLSPHDLCARKAVGIVGDRVTLWVAREAQTALADALYAVLDDLWRQADAAVTS